MDVLDEPLTQLQTMAWFKRKEKGINTPTENKKDTPKGLW